MGFFVVVVIIVFLAILGVRALMSDGSRIDGRGDSSAGGWLSSGGDNDGGAGD